MDPDTQKNSAPNEPVNLEANNKKRNYVFTILSSILLLIGIAYFGYWFIHGRYFSLLMMLM